MMLPKKLDDLDEFPLNTLLDHLDNPRFIDFTETLLFGVIWLLSFALELLFLF